MKNITINKLVKKNLIEARTNKIHQYYSKIKFTNETDAIKQYFYTTFDVIKEGYTLDEIDDYFNKRNLHEIEMPDISLNKIGSFLSSDDVKGTMWNTVKSQIKEWILYWLLTNIFTKGADNEFLKDISIALADINVISLLKLFKNEQECKEPMTQVIDAIGEVLLRKLGKRLVKGDSENSFIDNITGNELTWSQFFISMPVGNLLGELIRKSNIPDELADKFCKYIHK